MMPTSRRIETPSPDRTRSKAGVSSGALAIAVATTFVIVSTITSFLPEHTELRPPDTNAILQLRGSAP